MPTFGSTLQLSGRGVTRNAATLPDKEREEAPGSELQKRATQQLEELDSTRRLEPTPRPT
jgi:hypothetical protein